MTTRVEEDIIKGHELYLRHLLLLGQAAPVSLKAILEREVSKCGKCLADLLAERKDTFKTYHIAEFRQLFKGEEINTAIDSWDTLMLCVVVLVLFDLYLATVELEAIKVIKDQRNDLDYYAHSASISYKTFEEKWCPLHSALLELIRGFHDEKKRFECTRMIHAFKSEDIRVNLDLITRIKQTNNAKLHLQMVIQDKVSPKIHCETVETCDLDEDDDHDYPVFTERLQDRCIYTGESAILTCRLNVSEKAVTWQHNYKPVQETDNIIVVNKARIHWLAICHAKLTDAGRYSCAFGNSSTTASLRVLEKPLVITKRLCVVKTEAEVRENMDVVLTCEVNRRTNKAVWRHNGQVIEQHTRRVISIDDLEHRLTIRNAKFEDEGDYTVNFGDVTSSIKLLIKGAVDGSLNGGKHCKEHENIDSVPEWIKDETAWGSCIKQNDRKEAQRLISERILPTQKMLNYASVEFGRDSQILKTMCNKISSCIKAETNSIVNVWAGYKTIYDESIEENAIVFAVTTKAKIQIVNAFNYNVEQICIDEVNNSQENKDIQLRENKNPSMDEEINKAVTHMKHHSQGLMKSHSNITRISVSWIKSSRYGTEDAKITNEVCISLYVPRKGIIPINEKPFPKILNGFAVDVREGICVPFLGPHDVHESVKMGCAISGQSFAEQSNIGTIGGFIENGNEIYCLTSAHVFAQNPNLKDLQSSGTWIAAAASDDNPFNYVYQPSPPSEPFGTLVRAVFTEGGGGIAGVDAAAIQVRKRFPNSGIFPDAANDREAGFKETPMTFNSGKLSPSPNRMALVVKHGSTSGITKGSFRLCGGGIRTNTAHNWGYVLYNQYEIESFGNTLFSQPGDSGAMVFTVEGNELLGIGMVEAGMGNICLVTPIFDIFRALQIPGPFKMKTFMQDSTNTAIPVGCSVTTATDVIPQSDRTNDVNERFNYMDQALSQEVARQAKEIKEELHTKVYEINEKIERDITKLQTNIDRSMTSVEEKMNDMQNKNCDQMLKMKESMEEMLSKFLSQINQKQ